MAVDNRASPGISKKLENLLFKRALGEVELNDLVDAVRWMKSQPNFFMADRSDHPYWRKTYENQDITSVIYAPHVPCGCTCADGQGNYG
jgi:hypothetical protein